MERHPRLPEGSETLLTFHEGVRLLPYDDATGAELQRTATLTGFLTIGVGRNLTARGISTEEAAFLLANDLVTHWSDLVAALPWVLGLDPVRQLVLLDMAFNLGVPGLLKFKTTLAFVKVAKYDAASVTMLESVWADQVGARARRLSEMMRDGRLPSDVKGL